MVDEKYLTQTKSLMEKGKRKKTGSTQKANNNVAGGNSTSSGATLNVNGLNTPVKQ